MIPYGRQDIDDSDIAAVVEVLRSDWLTQGPAVDRFESAVAAFCGARYAVATCNATAALHLAYRALDLGPGDLLWTSPNTFVATANAAVFCGAQVDFVDIDPGTYNLCAGALEEKLRLAATLGQLPKIVVPVHFAGQPCDMDRISELGREYGFRIVEDASHAIGARYDGTRVGGGRSSDITVFSFHPVKIMTTGEGGMAVTNDAALDARLRLLRSHGTTRNPAEMQGASEGPWYYQQVDLGYNYRLTDIQAALGTSQLLRIEAFLHRRAALAERYDEALRSLPLAVPSRHPKAASSWHLYVVQLQLERLRRSRREIVEELRRRQVFAHVHYIPVHTQPYYAANRSVPLRLPVAEAYYEQAVSLPMFSRLGDSEQQEVVITLEDVLS
jgi:UDP-4-amino-4,6-dideoxy-N-acetyl-beta-L-altrosamine transaminase